MLHFTCTAEQHVQCGYTGLGVTWIDFQFFLISLRKENLNLLVRIKFLNIFYMRVVLNKNWKNLLVRTKFCWFWVVLAVRTEIHVYFFFFFFIKCIAISYPFALKIQYNVPFSVNYITPWGFELYNNMSLTFSTEFWPYDVAICF